MTVYPSVPRNASLDSEGEGNPYSVQAGRGLGQKQKTSTVISMKKPVGDNDFSMTGDHYDPHAQRDVDHPTS